jgi:hypothetical protein
MFHPLAEDFSTLKDAEVENKINELTTKYWQAQNPSVKHQISVFLDIYKTELSSRRAKSIEQAYQKRDKDLDKLIKVN